MRNSILRMKTLRGPARETANLVLLNSYDSVRVVNPNYQKNMRLKTVTCEGINMWILKLKQRGFVIVVVWVS